MPAPVTLCVIARNEAPALPACLASLLPVVADVVVLDTGSTDATVDVAAALGARVHTFTWIEDFSAARNAAAIHAREPFILMLDADEQLAPDSVDALVAYCASSGIAGRKCENVLANCTSRRRGPRTAR